MAVHKTIHTTLLYAMQANDFDVLGMANVVFQDIQICIYDVDGKEAAEKLLMKEQIDELTELVVDLVAHGSLPPAMLLRFRERGRNLNGRVMAALNKQYQQSQQGA
jgi:hypothetical protein